jgi:hypothetical protein
MTLLGKINAMLTPLVAMELKALLANAIQIVRVSSSIRTEFVQRMMKTGGVWHERREE